jgi:hypothetical protein
MFVVGTQANLGASVCVLGFVERNRLRRRDFQRPLITHPACVSFSIPACPSKRDVVAPISISQ